MTEAPAATALVLLIEDDVPMRKFLRTFLSGVNYRVEEAATAEEALLSAAQNQPDVIILDLGLPDMDGQELLRQLREWLKAPVIVLSARDQDAQKVAALDGGADDYLTKPFSTSELLARIRVALRHAAQAPEEGGLPVYQTGNLRVDLSNRRVFVRDKEIHLTPIEYKLLRTLVQHPGKVLSHQYLLKEAWGSEHAQDTQHLRVFMGALRRKIETNLAQPRHVLTERGIGYRLATD
ncbi:MAG TPA: response regulator [Pirellulales bacterium]|jgi:two-component system KDP operon response regulator KdpE